MGIYIPPNCSSGVEDLQVAWEACPTDCTPLVVGDLNVWFEDPANDRADAIINLLDEINITNLSRKFLPQRCSQQWRRARWTFRMRRGREWCYSQPDYFLGNKCITKRLRRVAFQSPRFHDSDHWAFIATFWGGSAHWLKSYQCDRQRFPLRLSHGEETEQTNMFSHFVAECVKPELRKRPGNDWILDRTWALVGQRMALRHVGKLPRAEGRRAKRLIWASLRNDKRARTKGVGNAIEAELAKGDVQEAFCLLKGWYRAASETVAHPCPQTMARQTEDRVELYWQRNSPGDLLPINLQGPAIPNNVPSDHEIRDAARNLPSGRAGGGWKMHVEDIKQWLHGITLEEDPKKGPNNVGEGDNWRLLVGLIQAIWTQGKIPQQFTWVIVVLLPKGSGDYRGIGLLEPLWKVVEQIMDRRLNALPL